MDISKLAKVSDSTFGGSSKALKQRKADATRKDLKDRLTKKLMDTEDTEQVVEAAKAELAGAPADDVLEVVIDVLDDVVSKLTTQVEDSKLAITKLKARAIKPRAKKSDAKTKAAFRKKLMDTEDTAGVIEAAKQELEVTDPATVVETVIEVLDDVISNISQE